MRLLFVGQTEPDSLQDYYQIDKEARGINSNNIDDFLQGKLDKQYGVFYTSWHDIGNIKKFIALINSNLLDDIIYNPPKEWNNKDLNYTTELLLENFSKFNKKKFDEHENFLNFDFKLEDIRQTESTQMWVAGCSFSSAVGVNNDQRWGYLLAQKLNIPVSFLARRSSGINYQIDQILSSDVRSGDTVVLQLTSFNRTDFYTEEKELIHIIATQYPNKDLENIFPYERLLELNIYEKTIRQIAKLTNYCEKLNVRLIIWQPLQFADKQSLFFLLERYKNFHLVDTMIDRGTDNQHPGPKSHQAYADFLYEKLK